MMPATDWQEIIADGEAERFQLLAEQLREVQRQNAKSGAPLRGLHAKTCVGGIGQFTILPDIPEHARIGVFGQHAAVYPAYVRFSNGAAVRHPDAKADVRGMAVKLLGVPGKKIIPGLEDATTQDFLGIRSRATPFANADDFVWFIRAAARPVTLLPRAIARFGLARALRLVSTLLKQTSKPITSVADSSYHSALPVQFGPYAVHYAFLAKSPEPTSRPEARGADKRRSSDYLTDELAERLGQGPVIYDFGVQFYVDEQRTPIEDPSREWSEADAPFVTIARLTLPAQELRSPRGRRIAEYIETLSFDPWHAPKEFRPLGSMMRARKEAYRVSTSERGAAREPVGVEFLS